MATVNYDLVFDGEDDYIEISDHVDFSVATTGQLSVSAWIRPDVLTFPVFQSIPTLEGIFENIDDAKAELRSNGYLKEDL